MVELRGPSVLVTELKLMRPKSNTAGLGDQLQVGFQQKCVIIIIIIRLVYWFSFSFLF